MAILNATPDSFFGESRVSRFADVLDKVEDFISAGADIIDIGACSSRPDGELVSCEEERRRLMPVLKVIREAFPNLCLSVDTFRAAIAEEAVDRYGVQIINDISGGEWDERMFDVVSVRQVRYVLSYMPWKDCAARFVPYQGSDIMRDMLLFFRSHAELLLQKGDVDVILDPGFGFAKTIEQNYEVLSRLAELGVMEMPILAGLSRKSMIYKPLQKSPTTALNGTTALNMAALINGATMLRVHDVREAKETISLFELLSKQRE